MPLTGGQRQISGLRQGRHQATNKEINTSQIMMVRQHEFFHRVVTLLGSVPQGLISKQTCTRPSASS